MLNLSVLDINLYCEYRNFAYEAKYQFSQLKKIIMKNILVAFDFSNNAVHALEYSIYLANHIDANLHLVWVDSTSNPDGYLNINPNLRIETTEQLKAIESKYKSQLNKGEYTTHLAKGKVYNEVAFVARKIKANYIIAGTHGTSGFEQYWIGSNAYRIVSFAPCPVITIRSNYDFSKGIQNIILPIDGTAESWYKVELTAMIASSFDAKIHQLILSDSPLNRIQSRINSKIAETKKIYDKYNVQFERYDVDSSNIVRTILDFAHSYNADLISIMTEHSSESGKMLLGQSSQQIINNSVIPILNSQTEHFKHV